MMSFEYSESYLYLANAYIMGLGLTSLMSIGRCTRKQTVMPLPMT